MQKKDKSSSLSKRLNFLVEESGIKQSHLANKLGLTPAAIHYLCNADVQTSKYTKKIAEILNVNEDWLANGKGEVYLGSDTGVNFKRFPIYYPDALLLALKQKTKAQAEGQYFYTQKEYDQHSMAIYITDNDMAPKFEIGDKVLIEPKETIQEGTIVLAYSKTLARLMIRLVHKAEQAQQYYLVLNTSRPILLDLKKGDKILGIYRECLKISQN